MNDNLHCGECPQFEHEDMDGFGFCAKTNREQYCSDLCNETEMLEEHLKNE